MNTSDGIPGSAVLEYVAHGGVEVSSAGVFEYQVEWSGPRATTQPSPILRSVSPETPKLRSVRRDLESMVANEEEVV